MDTTAHHRHDISDEPWARIESMFPDSKGKRGRPAGDNRHFLNAVLWIMRSGASWRDLPPDYGYWNSVFVRFRRLAKAGFWTRLAELFTNCPDFEWIYDRCQSYQGSPTWHGSSLGNRGRREDQGGG